MLLLSVSFDFSVPWRHVGGAAGARPGSQWFGTWSASRQRCFKRLVALMVAATFLPVVTAMLVCEVDCIAQALASDGQEHGEHGRTAHQMSPSNVDQADAHQGACHLAVTSLITVAISQVSAVLRLQDQWVRGAELTFASLIWPPPQLRPKAIFS